MGFRNFAANVGLQFHTPEEYFLGEDPSPFTRQFNPTTILQGESVNSTNASKSGIFSDMYTIIPFLTLNRRFAGQKPFEKTSDLDIVLFCGSPGAGKSTFYWSHLQPLGYARINQDILKTVSSLSRMYGPTTPHSLSNIV